MTNSKTMWMVRAGEDGYLFADFQNKKIVAIGWNEIGNLSKMSTSRDFFHLKGIKQILKEKYPDYKQGTLNQCAGMISRFRFDFKKGDGVITYNPEERIYLVGEILDNYEYNTKLTEYFHTRKVKWLGKVSRDKLSTPTKNTLGAISTIFKLSEDAKDEIVKSLKGKEPVEDAENEEAELDIIKEDMIAKAREFIKDKILDLNWEEMQELIAGILKSMGYKTTISSRGPDRGRDIQASPDGLGLEEPRIIVEVKHRSGGQTGAKEVRSFTGGLRDGDKGLFVSTSGFSKEAKYEAERSTVPVTLIDLDVLVRLIIQYYDKFYTEAKTLLPLIKIYWPA